MYKSQDYFGECSRFLCNRDDDGDGVYYVSISGFGGDLLTVDRSGKLERNDTFSSFSSFGRMGLER
ncbi:hypothetical protein L484_026363 [Morus notabilis]|uniref:Uncharacterized protein n=1 Tax=Morus notabilis TaxID=981085 RepID=W9RL58_9ROSA|nr:hypothetical protein L484_026363 [Morus notabilis]